MWVTEYEQDIESDLSAFHRIDDPMTIEGPRYFRLAARLGAYAGVIAARALEERNSSEPRHAAPAPTSGPAASVTPTGVTHVDNDVAFAMLAGEGWIEHVTEGA